jgi:hypothetical protein
MYYCPLAAKKRRTKAILYAFIKHLNTSKKTNRLNTGNGATLILFRGITANTYRA